jgi:integrase
MYSLFWKDLSQDAVDMNVEGGDMSGWKEEKAKLHGELSTILSKFAGTRVNGKVASKRTMTAYGQVLRMCFNTLHKLGFHLQNPRNLNDRHIQALCRYWHESDLQPSTKKEYLSKLRVFSEEWIKRPEPVRSLEHYLSDVNPDLLVVSTVALQSKSWTANGINVEEMIHRADEEDPRFGLMLRMKLEFGLRRKEVLLIKPWKADMGDKLVIYPGEAKGGRPRDIHIYSKTQREVLDYVKSRVRKNEHLGWETTYGGKQVTFEYNCGRYSRLMDKIGISRKKANVTGHGLRAQYAENTALQLGFIPFTLGGSNGQMDEETLRLRRQIVSELLGHTRESITAAYYGAAKRMGLEPEYRQQLMIEYALQYCHAGMTTQIPAERQADCWKILNEIDSLGLEISMRQIQLLWQIHSGRYARTWVTPERGIREAMEAAAIRLINLVERKTA